MLTWNEHKLRTLKHVFKFLEDNKGLNPRLYITTEENRNIILPIPQDLLELDNLRDITDEVIRYITKTAKAQHVSFVSEVNKVMIEQNELTEDEQQQIKNKSISIELKEKIEKRRKDALVVHTFSKDKGSINKEFMMFHKLNGMYVPDKQATEAMAEGATAEGRFMDLLEA
tara:strand:+ start:1664 stop:2176 length:513 start_codon:yes stop_codon:yes gene_type:complete